MSARVWCVACGEDLADEDRPCACERASAPQRRAASTLERVAMQATRASCSDPSAEQGLRAFAKALRAAAKRVASEVEA